MIVDSKFNSVKFRHKQKAELAKSILNTILYLFFFWYLFLNNVFEYNFSFYLKYILPLTALFIIIGFYRRSVNLHNLNLKNQVKEIELNEQELLITNYAGNKILFKKDDLILIPQSDPTYQLFGRHKTDLMLTLENGSCFYIYQELFNTHQIEDSKSENPGKRYYTV
jgi:hypothetical protein